MGLSLGSTSARRIVGPLWMDRSHGTAVWYIGEIFTAVRIALYTRRGFDVQCASKAWYTTFYWKRLPRGSTSAALCPRRSTNSIAFTLAGSTGLSQEISGLSQTKFFHSLADFLTFLLVTSVKAGLCDQGRFVCQSLCLWAGLDQLQKQSTDLIEIRCCEVRMSYGRPSCSRY